MANDSNGEGRPGIRSGANGTHPAEGAHVANRALSRRGFIFSVGAIAGTAILEVSGASAAARWPARVRAPVNTTPPAIAGSPIVGNVLTASPGSWS